MWRAWASDAGTDVLLLTTSSVQAASPKASDFDGDFDYFILTRPWGPSVCPQGGLSPNALCRVNTPHIAPPPAKWTIHGLWPAKNNGVFIDYCFKNGSIDNEAQVAKNLQAFIFTPGRPSDAVLKEQSSVWPSFLVRDEDLPALAANRAPPPNPARYNLDFWKHEWLAHGTCAFKSRAGLESDTTLHEKYFSLAKHLHARLASSNPKIPVTLNKDPKGQNGWIVMGKGYTSRQILRNFKDAYGVQVTFTCAARDRMHPDGFRLILEVKWCYDKKLTLRDCPSIGCVEDGDFKYGFQESTTEDGQVDAAGLVTETTVVAASSAAAAVLQPANKVEARTAALTAGFSCLASTILGAVGATKTSAKQAELQLKGNIAFDGINIWSLTLPPAVNASVLGKAVVSRLVSCTKRAGPRLVVKSTVAPPAGMLLSATFSVDIKNRLVWLQSSQGNYTYLLDEASKMFNSLWGLTPKPSTTPESFSASMSMAVGSAGLQTVLVQVGTILTPAKLASRLGFTWPFPDSFLTISNSSVTFTGRKVSYADYAMENPRVSVQARVKIPDVNLNAQAMIDVQSKQSLTLTLMESWTVPGVPNLEINPADTLPSSLTLSSAAGVQGFVSARFVDVPVQVLISIASKTAQARGAKKLTLAAEASNVNLGKLVPAVWPNTPSLIKAVLANTTFVRAAIKYSGGACSLSADAKLDVLGSLQTLAGCQLPAGVVSIDTLAFSIDRGTGSWSAVGKLVDIPIAARFTVANTKKRMGFRLTTTV